MRQFLLAGKVAYSTATDLNTVPEGAVGFYLNKDGNLAVSADGTDIKGEAMLVLGRKAVNGGPITLPIHKHAFEYVKGEYQAATTYASDFTCPAPVKGKTYTVVLVKKGQKFNERNKWSCDILWEKAVGGASDLASAIAKQFKQNALNAGIEVKDNAAKVEFKALEAGVDYNVILTKDLSDVAVNVTAKGHPAYGDAAYVADLANKAAADAGMEYTYQDYVTYLYPEYPLNPLAVPNAEDKGFTIFTLKFSEPRNTRTIDTAINQVVQIAFPTGSAGIDGFETVCKALAK